MIFGGRVRLHGRFGRIEICITPFGEIKEF
jgi:hypothetical protein